LKSARKSLSNEVKLLLLGAGESGKSTFAKQMRIIHQNGFSEEERLTQRPVVYYNVLDSMKKLIQAVNRFKLDERSPGLALLEDNEEAAELLDEIDLAVDLQFTTETVQFLKALWADPAVQAAYERRNEFQVRASIDAALMAVCVREECSSHDHTRS
jgi:predicted AAA+ superfamily ATPase